MALQLEVGKYYRRRDGLKAGPAKLKDPGTYLPWTVGLSGGDHWYNDHGKSCAMEHCDLIAEWQDTPDLTAITTPFGLLDEVTQEALRAHGGPYEWWEGDFWVEDRGGDPFNTGAFVVRVKPAPKVETVTEDRWLMQDGRISDTDWENTTPIRVTFTRTNGVIDLDSYKVEAR